MTIKTTRHFLCFALLMAFGLKAAEETATPKLSMSNLSGVPTPLEEYGLSIGDITVTRVINPLGQLKQGSPIMLARRIRDITNPWQELTEGTALIVDGKKAVIRKIHPPKAPQDKADNLKIVITAEEISGTKMILEWHQKLHNLNSQETVEARKQTVTLVKENLRVGSHLILNKDRVVVTEQTFRYPTDSTLDRDLELFIKYQSLSSGEGELTGKPSMSELQDDSAWDLQANDGATLENDTVQLITWELHNRDGDENYTPAIDVLHRFRGTISHLQLKGKREVLATAKFDQDGHAHTHIFKWEQDTDNKGQSLWRLAPGADDYVEIFRINDTNISFKVAPDALLDANRRAAGLLQEKIKNPGNIKTRSLTPGNVDADSLTNQIDALKKIVNSDASKAIKLDAKRQAVIYLARYYEHSAVSHKALAQEYLARADFQLERARILELHAWVNSQMLGLIGIQRIERRLSTLATDKPDPAQPEDRNVGHAAIIELIAELKKYEDQIQDAALKTDSDLEQDHNVFLRKNNALNAASTEHREKAKEYQNKAQKLQKKINEDFLESLKFWSEYIYRTEGLIGDDRPEDLTSNERLSEGGVEGNSPASDPYIPEILLRQAWIYRQMDLPERALSTYYSVLSAATQQKVNNLTRFKRIVLVARSQIANTYYEGANPLELKDYIAANDLYERLLKAEQEEMNTDLIELKLLRSLSKADEISRIKLRKLKLKQINLETETSPVFRDVETELKQTKAEIQKLNENRQEYWKKMEQHALKFIERSDSGSIISHNHTGEVRYYLIMAYNALAKYQHVWQSMEVLLENESTPNDQRKAWADARVRVVIDIAHRLFTNGTALMEDNREQMVAVLSSGGRTNEIEAWRRNLESALVYYKWALLKDQSYRSQILIRQQIGFCHHRLGNTNEALKQYKSILDLCEMHPSDVKNNPTIKVIRDITRLRVKLLDSDIKRNKEASERPKITP